MSNQVLKEKVLIDRIKNQTSYSELKRKFGVSKSTLSYWLKGHPLSKDRINTLRANSEQRIERYRNTMALKRELKNKIAYNKISKDIKTINNREMFLCGLFLYWAEGGKTRSSGITLTNTNPFMLKFYMKWLNIIGVPKHKLRIHLHLYSDMDITKEIHFWSNILGLSRNYFQRPYIKKTTLSSLTYKNGFGHGTCSIIYDNKSISDYVLMGIKRLQELSN